MKSAVNTRFIGAGFINGDVVEPAVVLCLYLKVQEIQRDSVSRSHADGIFTEVEVIVFLGIVGGRKVPLGVRHHFITFTLGQRTREGDS